MTCTSVGKYVSKYPTLLKYAFNKFEQVFFYLSLKSIKNDDLDNLMEKSAKNQLAEDGLSSLKYKKIEEKNFPLYTWIKVQVPKGYYYELNELRENL